MSAGVRKYMGVRENISEYQKVKMSVNDVEEKWLGGCETETTCMQGNVCVRKLYCGSLLEKKHVLCGQVRNKEIWALCIGIYVSAVHHCIRKDIHVRHHWGYA